METFRKLSLVLSAALLAMVLAGGPALATESGGGGEGEGGKIELATNQHELVGLILLGALGIGGLAALVNARKQLRGERKQATGEFRWR
ncbi:MAG: hypothetical protein KY457_12920 [Actinobacteria bacterium]|nr:hypothetical protein [Actinomycetota bacterium]